MFTMRKETKFNYGLLLFGAAMPPIIDAVFGREWGLAALVLVACAGLVLLISGHFHREKDETETRLKQNGRFALFGGVLALAIIGVPWAIRKAQESPNASEVSEKLSAAVLRYAENKHEKEPHYTVNETPEELEATRQQMIKFGNEMQDEFVRTFGPRIYAVIEDARRNGLNTGQAEVFCISQSSSLTRIQQCGAELAQLSAKLK